MWGAEGGGRLHCKNNLSQQGSTELRKLQGELIERTGMQSGKSKHYISKSLVFKKKN